jgi:hypothetical protein
VSYIWKAFHGQEISLKQKFIEDPVNISLRETSKVKEVKPIQDKSE